MREIEVLGRLEDINGHDILKRVYSIDGVSPTLDSCSGGNRQPKILVGGDELDKIFAMRGRYNEDGSTSQQVEFRKDGVSSTLTGVQKDNMLLKDGKEGFKQVTVNDLFCGAGGMALGFKRAGFEIAGAWDFDKYAVESYKHNVGDHVLQTDITQMVAADLPSSDVWTFGFPCQDISVAGNKKGMIKGETRSGLFYEVMRLLEETGSKPKIILAENVKMLKKLLPTLEEEYNAAGYKIYYTLYNSKYWGVPQNRERYFVIGVHESIDKEFEFPIQQDKYIPRLSTILESEVDEKYYIDPEKTKGIIEQVADSLKKTRKRNDISVKVLANGDVRPYITDAKKTGIGEMKVNYEKNESYTCLANHVNKIYGESTNYRIRKLTPTEYKRLQGFPESYEQVVSNSQAYRQYGNAVTVNVAQAIAERIKMFLLSL